MGLGDYYLATVRREPTAVAYWRANDPNGSVVIQDSGSRYGLNGTCLGVGGLVSSGPLILGDSSAASASFGTTGRYISVPDISALRVTADIALEMWTIPTGSGYMIAKTSGANIAAPYSLSLVAGVPTFAIGNGTTQTIISAPSALSTTAPSYVVARRFRNIATISVNGVVVVTANVAGQAVADAGNPLSIGAAPIINLVTNPSFEVDTSGWSNAGGLNNPGSTLTRVTSQAFSGAASMRIVTTNALAAEGTDYAFTQTFLSGAPYSISLYMKGNAGGESINWGVFDGGGSGDSALTTSVLTNGWARYTQLWTPGANRTNTHFLIRTSSAAAVTIFVDAAQVTQSPTAAAYFDGSSADALWNGTANASTSTFYSTYNGLLAEVALHSGALSDARIKRHWGIGQQILPDAAHYSTVDSPSYA